MIPGKSIFIDTNILIYANSVHAPFHREAREQLTKYSKEGYYLWISSQVLREFTSVMTRPQTW